LVATARKKSEEDVYANAKNNNNIAWKNVSIVEVPTESGTIPEAVVGVWNVYNQVQPPTK